MLRNLARTEIRLTLDLSRVNDTDAPMDGWQSSINPEEAAQYDAQARDADYMRGLLSNNQSGQMDPNPSSYGSGFQSRPDYAYEEYLNHMLNAAGPHPQGTFLKGPLAGLTPSEAQDKLRTRWATEPQAVKEHYAQMTHNQDTRLPGEFESKGQEYEGQTRALSAGLGNRNDPVTGRPMASAHYDTSGQAYPQATGATAASGSYSPNAAATQVGVVGHPDTFNPGSMNSDDGTRHLSISDASASDSSGINGGGGTGAQANQPGQIYRGNLATSAPVSQPGNASFSPQSMGTPSDTDRFGPRMSGGNGQPVVSTNDPLQRISTGLRPAYPSYSAPASTQLQPPPDPQSQTQSPNRMTDTFVGPPSAVRPGMTTAMRPGNSGESYARPVADTTPRVTGFPSSAQGMEMGGGGSYRPQAAASGFTDDQPPTTAADIASFKQNSDYANSRQQAPVAQNVARPVPGGAVRGI
jgi:hypothetical protein